MRGGGDGEVHRQVHKIRFFGGEFCDLRSFLRNYTLSKGFGSTLTRTSIGVSPSQKTYIANSLSNILLDFLY